MNQPSSSTIATIREALEERRQQVSMAQREYLHISDELKLQWQDRLAGIFAALAWVDAIEQGAGEWSPVDIGDNEDNEIARLNFDDLLSLIDPDNEHGPYAICRYTPPPA